MRWVTGIGILLLVGNILVSMFVVYVGLSLLGEGYPFAISFILVGSTAIVASVMIVVKLAQLNNTDGGSQQTTPKSNTSILYDEDRFITQL